jgi:hypothetical protein
MNETQPPEKIMAGFILVSFLRQQRDRSVPSVYVDKHVVARAAIRRLLQRAVQREAEKIIGIHRRCR